MFYVIFKICSLIFDKKWIIKWRNFFFYFLFFNFPVRFMFQSSITLLLFSMKTLYENVHENNDDFQKAGFGLAIGYLISLLVCWITVLAKICLTKMKKVPFNFTEFYAGLRKSKWKVFLLNFHFIFL